jgi:hypothetical protein
MFIFQRIVTLQGGPRRALAWASEMTTFVSENSDLDPLLWVGGFGYPIGTVAWSARVESRAELADGMNALMAHEGYHDLIEAGVELFGQPGEDLLLERIHPDGPLLDPPPVGSVAEIISATAAPGKVAAAMAWGVEIANTYAEISGTGVSFFADAYGAFGRVTWIVVHPDMAAADAANAAVNSSADYVTSVDSGGDLFVPASGHRSASIRVG